MPPHANWAHLYDSAYEEVYGVRYKYLTDLTVNTVQTLGNPPLSVVDFGAGTGRLTIPLSERGYAVTAVEPCQQMLNVLQEKACERRLQVQSFVQSMQDFDGAGKFDIALCVFTTVIYLLDENSLREGIAKFVQSLKVGGKLLIDIPKRAAFTSRKFENHNLKRDVTVTRFDGNIYNYREQIKRNFNGHQEEIEDNFQIRFWPSEIVLDALREAGSDWEGPINRFDWTGADYYSGTRSR